MEFKEGFSRSESYVQAERKARENDLMDLRRWLDDAQGQLQNTQTALNQRNGVQSSVV